MQEVTKTTDWLIRGMKKEELSFNRMMASVVCDVYQYCLENEIDKNNMHKVVGMSKRRFNRFRSLQTDLKLSEIAAIGQKIGKDYRLITDRKDDD